MTISKTFCPAKWDEILVNLSANYVYSCCKSIPIKITKKEDIEKALNDQRNNLLNGIQDPACNYCWQVENTGHSSLRKQYLTDFDYKKINQYINNKTKLKKIEVSLGNECNFQCTYCNPKFSSQWEVDVKNKSYKIYSDRYFYDIDKKNVNNLSDTIQWLTSYDSIDSLWIIGGEPLQNKNFIKIINHIKSNHLGFSTNLSCKTTKPIDNILNLAIKYETIKINVSIDSTEKNAEFSRYGMDYEKLLENIEYLLKNAPTNVAIAFNSLMTSITIRDIDNMVDLIEGYYKNNSKIKWNINFCRDPLIFTFNTLPDQYKPAILKKIVELENKSYIFGVDMLKGAILNSKFNNTLYNQMKHFLKEFSDRKNIKIPIELK